MFCDDVDPLVIPDIIKTRMVRGFRFILVKMPVLWKDQWFEDLALASGATVIDPVAGFTLKMANTTHLGKFGNITITKEDTYIDGIENMASHITILEADGTDDSKLRASRLNTKTARYFVGAQSDSALSYRRLKVEDAISASWQALNGGVVPGGGVALHNAADEMSYDTTGGRILREALCAPIVTICINAGIKYAEVVFSSPLEGVDTKTGKVVPMFDAGIIDPANVVLNAVKNAISVAAAVLTANTVVTLPRIEQPSNQP